MAKTKRTNNYPLRTTQTTKYRTTQTPTKSRGEFMRSGRISSSCSTSVSRRAIFFYCVFMFLHCLLGSHFSIKQISLLA